jgi:hypothetical protein
MYPECPICGKKIMFVAQCGLDLNTGKAHCCTIAFFGQDGILEALGLGLAHLEETSADECRELREARDAKLAETLTTSFVEALDHVSTLDDILDGS